MPDDLEQILYSLQQAPTVPPMYDPSALRRYMAATGGVGALPFSQGEYGPGPWVGRWPNWITELPPIGTLASVSILGRYGYLPWGPNVSAAAVAQYYANVDARDQLKRALYEGEAQRLQAMFNINRETAEMSVGWLQAATTPGTMTNMMLSSIDPRIPRFVQNLRTYIGGGSEQIAGMVHGMFLRATGGMPLSEDQLIRAKVLARELQAGFTTETEHGRVWDWAKAGGLAADEIALLEASLSRVGIHGFGAMGRTRMMNLLGGSDVRLAQLRSTTIQLDRNRFRENMRNYSEAFQTVSDMLQISMDEMPKLVRAMEILTGGRLGSINPQQLNQQLRRLRAVAGLTGMAPQEILMSAATVASRLERYGIHADVPTAVADIGSLSLAVALTPSSVSPDIRARYAQDIYIRTTAGYGARAVGAITAALEMAQPGFESRLTPEARKLYQQYKSGNLRAIVHAPESAVVELISEMTGTSRSAAHTFLLDPNMGVLGMQKYGRQLLGLAGEEAAQLTMGRSMRTHVEQLLSNQGAKAALQSMASSRGTTVREEAERFITTIYGVDIDALKRELNSMPAAQRAAIKTAAEQLGYTPQQVEQFLGARDLLLTIGHEPGELDRWRLVAAYRQLMETFGTTEQNIAAAEEADRRLAKVLGPEMRGGLIRRIIEHKIKKPDESLVDIIVNEAGKSRPELLQALDKAIEGLEEDLKGGTTPELMAAKRMLVGMRTKLEDEQKIYQQQVERQKKEKEEKEAKDKDKEKKGEGGIDHLIELISSIGKELSTAANDLVKTLQQMKEED